MIGEFVNKTQKKEEFMLEAVSFEIFHKELS